MPVCSRNSAISLSLADAAPPNGQQTAPVLLWLFLLLILRRTLSFWALIGAMYLRFFQLFFFWAH